MDPVAPAVPHAEVTTRGLSMPSVPSSLCHCFQLSLQHTTAPAHHHEVLQKGLMLSGASRHKVQLALLQEAPPPLLHTGLLVGPSFRLIVQWNLLIH